MERIFELTMNFSSLVGPLSVSVGFFIFFGLLDVFTPHIRPGPNIFFQREFRTDFTYKLFYSLLTAPVFFHFLIPAVGFSMETFFVFQVRSWFPDWLFNLEPVVSGQSDWLIAIEFFAFYEVVSYWRHRLLHTPLLWKFHAVHHSPQHMDWLSASRSHFLEHLFVVIPKYAPVLFLNHRLHSEAIQLTVTIHALRTFWVAFVHSRVNWNFRPVHFIISSPIYHNWHHSVEKEAQEKNYSNVFPILDILFGTYYYPKDKLPVKSGLKKPLPESFWKQQLYPFRKSTALN